MPAFTPERVLPILSGFPDAPRFWVAYSGGLDSEVLLHAVVMLRNRLPAEVGAVHLNHGLHPDSGTWAEHCARRCEKLGVPLRVRRLDVARARGESLEAVARDRRYESLAEMLGRDELLLTAQHRDDQAETLLLALMRGSGPKGLAAMPPVAPLGTGWLVRPLLDLRRAELAEYARRSGLDWVDDPGNSDLAFDRNFIRHRVLPLLTERWPGCAATIARSAGHCAEAQGLIDRLTRDALAKVIGGRRGTLSVSRLKDLDLPLRRAVLRQWISDRNLPLPGARHLDRVISEVLTARADAQPRVAWSGCEVRRYRDDLFALKPLPPVPGLGPLHWRAGMLELPCGLGRLEMLNLQGDRVNPGEVLAGGLLIKFRVQGLTCRPPWGGHRRPLKKLYQEAGVPSWLRPYIPLVFAAGALVAIGGVKVCHGEQAGGYRDFRVRWSDAPDEGFGIGLGFNG